MPRLGWRWLLALSSLPSSLLLIFYRVTPESPRYLCLMGRTTEAIDVLEKIARMNGTELPCGTLVSDHQIELQEKSIDPSEDANLLSPRTENATRKGLDSNIGGISSLLVLLSPKLVRSTLLLWVVFFGNAFSYYGLVLLTSELNNGNSKCMPTKVQSQESQDVNYKNVFIASFAGNLVYYLNIIYIYIYICIYICLNACIYLILLEGSQVTFNYNFPEEFPGLLIAAATVDRLGRKLSMSAMFFLCCFCLLPLVFHQPEGLTTGLLFGARICITATFTIICIYAPEVNY